MQAQETKATEWISGYVSNMAADLLRGESLISKALTLKILGEFSLFIFLHGKNARETRRVIPSHLVKTFNQVAAYVGSVTPNELGCRNIELNQIRLCLGLSGLGSLSIENDVTRIQTIKPDEDNISIEHAYILGVSGKEQNKEYWSIAASMLMKEMLNDGASRKWLYQLTHLVFFNSNFGSNKPSLGMASVLISSIYDICRSTFFDAVQNKDWDLAIELALACSYLRDENSIDSDMQLHITDSILKQQLANGCVLSDGEWRDMPSKFNSKLSYSLFHTTTVAILLLLELDKKGITISSTRTLRADALAPVS